MREFFSQGDFWFYLKFSPQKDWLFFFSHFQGPKKNLRAKIPGEKGGFFPKKKPLSKKWGAIDLPISLIVRGTREKASLFFLVGCLFWGFT